MFGRPGSPVRTGNSRPPGTWRALRAVLATASVVAMVIQPGFAPAVSADPASPLAVTVTATPSPVASGEQLTYTIAITNTGGAKVSSVVMTDQVNGVGTVQQPPALPQLTITSTQGPCAQGGANGNVVTCQIGTIGGNGSVTITIRGQVTAASGTTLNNTASVTGTRSAQNFTTNASSSVLVEGGTWGGPLPDLTLNKTGPTSVTVGDAMTYTLTINNVGTANTSNVLVVDTLPAGVAYTGNSTTSLFSCTPSGTNPVTVTCTGGTVNAGANATIKINATAPGAAGTITNTAIVDPDDAIAELNEVNNSSASVNTSVGDLPPPSPALTIVKTDNNPDVYGWSSGAGPDPVNPGQVLTYKIQVENTASTRANDVVVTDGTQGLEASSITASQVVVNGTVGNTGGCFVTAPRVRCAIRTLNPGGTITITIRGTVVTSAGTTIFNTASVTGNIKNTGVSATDLESTTVRPEVDLTITKAGSPNPVCARSWPQPGEHLSNAPDGLTSAGGSTPALLAPPVCEGGLRYDFVVGNSGNGEASNVTVRDPLPAGSILDSYETDGGFACSVASGVVTCSGGTIPQASTVNLSFVLVPPKSTGTITNTATVDPNNAIFEPDETNNTASASTDVVTGVNLVVWKSDSKQPNSPGAAEPSLIGGTSTDLGDGYDPIATRGTETYTIYVDNVGTQDTTGIKVLDALPADSVFLSVIADPAHGFTCSHDGAARGGNVTCVGGHLLGTEAEFYDPAGPAPAGPGDDFATIKIRVFARSTVGTMHNEVRVDPDDTIAEANELDNTATDDTAVIVGNADKGAYQQLAIVKTNDNPAGGTVATNGVLTYRLTVSNLGTDPVSNAVVRDALPAGSRFISVADTDAGVHRFFCSHDGAMTGGVVTCTGGDFDGTINGAGVGAMARDILVTVFAPSTPGTATNNATVDPADQIAEGNEFDNDAQVTTTVAACTDLANCTATNAFNELTIDKTQVSPAGDVARNGIITYDLEAANLGTDSVHDVTVTDRLPSGFRFIDAADTVNDPNAFTCSGPDATSDDPVHRRLPQRDGQPDPGGAPTTRHIRTNPACSRPTSPATTRTPRSWIRATRSPRATSSTTRTRSRLASPTAAATRNIDLTVDKTQEKVLDQVDADTSTVQVAPGGPMKYVLEVKNLASGADSGTAFNVKVVDVLPANSTFFKAEDEAAGPGNFSCAQMPGQPNTILCTGGTIPAGGARKIDVWAIAPRGLDQIATNQGQIQQTLTNSAFVDPYNEIPEGDETNNVDSVQTLVKPKVNLTVVSKEGPSQANQNQEADYVITVKNEKTWGDGAIAFDAVVVDYLPVGLIPLSVSTDTSNMACETQENPVNLVTCNGDIEPDQQVVITVHVFITAENGSLDNEACIDPDHQIDETTRARQLQDQDDGGRASAGTQPEHQQERQHRHRDRGRDLHVYRDRLQRG